MRGKDLIRERKCAVCKKTFVITEYWAYKKVSGCREMMFCSWGCQRKYERSHGTKIERRERVIQAIKDGLTNGEIYKLLGEESNKVNYWRNKLEKEKSIEARAEGENKDSEAQE